MNNNITYDINPIEKGYLNSTEIAHRKKYAQFFTPQSIALFMSKWVLGNKTGTHFLDPAVGTGIFIRSLLELNNDIFIKGYDVDSNILDVLKMYVRNNQLKEKVNIICKDYMFNDWNNRYDGIICNPPYLKFQDFYNKDEALQEFQIRLGMTLSGFSNIYTLFLLKSINQLNVDGRAAYIIPSEFLNSDYGKTVKRYLIDNKTLRYVIIFNFDKMVFDDALTTSSIFLFSNDDSKQDIEFISINKAEELEDFSMKLAAYPDVSLKSKKVSFSSLDPNIKWRNYYQGTSKNKYTNLAPFSNYCKVVRGIATGSNDYFTFDVEKKESFLIPSKYLIPCITKSNQVKSPFFTTDNFNELKDRNQKVFLFDASNSEDVNVRSYLKLGEKLDIDKKFLTSHRTPWYAIENRPPSPIWVGVFNRGGLRFIRNEADIRNLTTFHCIYVTALFSEITDLIFSYLLTDVAREIFNDNRREYGGGLEKFEPNDLNSSSMFDFSVLSKKQTSDILFHYNAYRDSCLKNKPNLQTLSHLNNIYLQLLKNE